MALPANPDQGDAQPVQLPNVNLPKEPLGTTPVSDYGGVHKPEPLTIRAVDSGN
jgi:hypothetical protein